MCLPAMKAPGFGLTNFYNADKTKGIADRYHGSSTEVIKGTNTVLLLGHKVVNV